MMHGTNPPDSVDPAEREGVEGYAWFNVFDSGDWPKRGEPFKCPKCGTTRLECFSSGPNETAVRCPDCRVWTVVHEG
jgi:DNA-directed RNA polymerase subunit RPC12/RpoP